MGLYRLPFGPDFDIGSRGEGGPASPGISAEPWLSLQVKGEEAPQHCLEEGEQTHLLVPADNKAFCVGQHCSFPGWGNLCLNTVVVLHLCIGGGLAERGD